jgi:phosphoribosyl 1,2-cyclic phosphodiesterase
MPLYLRTLCSGSDANATFLSDGKTHLLIDAGLSLKSAEEALSRCNVAPGSLSGILITHEHIDHVRARTCSAKSMTCPSTPPTHLAMLEKRPSRKLPSRTASPLTATAIFT